MSKIQWVNLAKEDIFAEDKDVGSKQRCGALDLKITFQKDEVPLAIKVKVTDSSADNVVYTEEELTRNKNFRMTNGLSSFSNTREFTLEESIFLPAAGGNVYKIEAVDENNQIVTSEEIETRRKLFYQLMIMSDTTGQVSNYSLSSMEAHADKYFITLQKKGDLKNIDYFKTIEMQDGGNLDQFGQKVDAAFDLHSSLKPLSMPAVFSNYIANKGEAEYFEDYILPNTNNMILLDTNHILIGLPRYLWHGLNVNADAAKSYFISGELIGLTPTIGDLPRETISLADVDLLGSAAYSYGGYSQLKIARNPKLDAIIKSGAIRLSVKVNIVQGWTNGFSWSRSGGKLITTAEKVRWEDMSKQTRTYTWNHEVGHRFGMTAHGKRSNNTLPDEPSTLYSDSIDKINYGGHRGPHCNNGATYDPATDSWSGVPVCVMFGANGIGSSHSPDDYCSICQPIVRKVDLSA